ncbi:hypothetical protein AAF712_013062 [Marasmius tenuissimus]|uniref:Uncharacterized protein n=1 Tax=Marasmius tenuissimus TaxID=585030 RepID=A0ABR2ZHG8_9AGAR
MAAYQRPYQPVILSNPRVPGNYSGWRRDEKHERAEAKKVKSQSAGNIVEELDLGSSSQSDVGAKTNIGEEPEVLRVQPLASTSTNHNIPAILRPPIAPKPKHPPQLSMAQVMEGFGPKKTNNRLKKRARPLILIVIGVYSVMFIVLSLIVLIRAITVSKHVISVIPEFIHLSLALNLNLTSLAITAFAFLLIFFT